MSGSPGDPLCRLYKPLDDVFMLFNAAGLWISLGRTLTLLCFNLLCLFKITTYIYSRYFEVDVLYFSISNSSYFMI